VPSYICPADDPYQRNGYISIMHFTSWNPSYGEYVFRTTSMADSTFGANSGANLGRTNYLGVGGYMGATMGGLDFYQGVFVSQRQVTIAQIASRDGCSNTMFFGEAVGDDGTNISGGMSFSWMAGWMPTGWSLNAGPQKNYYQFSSYHPGVVLFAFGDGSVHPISVAGVSSNFGPYLWASGYKDGVSYNWDDLAM
jgi:hypothetical protein